MNRIVVLAHKRTVGSGSVLAKELGAKCVVPRFAPKGGFQDGDTLINWGVGAPPKFSRRLEGKDITIINSFFSVRTAVNKLKTLSVLQEQGIPSLRPILNVDAAIRAYHKSPPNAKIFARSLLCGSQGQGIDVYSDLDDFMESDVRKYKMFTLGFPKNREFRVHVFNGEVIDYAQKKRMGSRKRKEAGVESVNRDIRSHDRGWVFTKVNVEVYEEVKKAAIDAVEALGLDFGAVDVLAVAKQKELQRLVVCEVNTSPSLSADSTLSSYVEYIRNHI